MKISATVKNTETSHVAEVDTAGHVQALNVPLKRPGRGSGVNGGEFLMLALATCYCNDIYREADRLGLVVDEVEVEASAEFNGIGLAASHVQYRARIRSSASSAEIKQLLSETDAVAEVHNTLRAGVPVEWVPWGEAR